jgi:hypothetical protein
LLELNISEDAKRAVRRPISLRGKLSKEALATNIQKLTVGNEFDGERIARYLGVIGCRLIGGYRKGLRRNHICNNSPSE